VLTKSNLHPRKNQTINKNKLSLTELKRLLSMSYRKYVISQIHLHTTARIYEYTRLNDITYWLICKWNQLHNSWRTNRHRADSNTKYRWWYWNKLQTKASVIKINSPFDRIDRWYYNTRNRWYSLLTGPKNNKSPPWFMNKLL